MNNRLGQLVVSYKGVLVARLPELKKTMSEVQTKNEKGPWKWRERLIDQMLKLVAFAQWLTFAWVNDGQSDESSHTNDREHDEEGYAFVLIEFSFLKTNDQSKSVVIQESSTTITGWVLPVTVEEIEDAHKQKSNVPDEAHTELEVLLVIGILADRRVELVVDKELTNT